MSAGNISTLLNSESKKQPITENGEPYGTYVGSHATGSSVYYSEEILNIVDNSLLLGNVPTLRMELASLS